MRVAAFAVPRIVLMMIMTVMVIMIVGTGYDFAGVSGTTVVVACMLPPVGRREAIQLGQESVALRPTQAQTDGDDQAIARDLDGAGSLLLPSRRGSPQRFRRWRRRPV